MPHRTMAMYNVRRVQTDVKTTDKAIQGTNTHHKTCLAHKARCTFAKGVSPLVVHNVVQIHGNDAVK